jgi:hypothetical protein
MANGNSTAWKQLADRAEAATKVFCKYYEGKALFTGMLHLYAEIHQELNESVVREDAESSEEFREQRRRKRTSSGNETVQAKKSSLNPGIRNTR